MLLIFFLVTTTMDVDSGLERRLPQWSEEEPEDQPEIKERNVFVVLVNRNNDLLVGGEETNIVDLRERAKEFMANPYDEETLPEKEPKDVPYFGEVMVTKGVISLRNDNDTKYGTYIAVQNELVAAVNELRNELAKQHFGKPYDDLELDKQDAIRKVIPSKISEAERNK
jgi:biopolymer transport protein ExbD